MISTGAPFTGQKLSQLQAFLQKHNLFYDEGIQRSVCLLDDQLGILATASLEENVIKCIAATEPQQMAALISHLVAHCKEQGRDHIFLHTTPQHRQLFQDLNFFPILETDDVLLMENQRLGFSNYLTQLLVETPSQALRPGQRVGSVVVHCNPFTLGHRHLIEESLKLCDHLHVFLISDHRSLIPAEDRYQLVQLGTRDLKGVILHRACDYILSAATFPTYFQRDTAQMAEENSALDLELFATLIAPTLNITTRFMGTEPLCPLSDSYNSAMKKHLPKQGVSVVIQPRIQTNDTPVSASLVRQLVVERKFDQLDQLVPPSTLQYLTSSPSLG